MRLLPAQHGIVAGTAAQPGTVSVAGSRCLGNRRSGSECQSGSRRRIDANHLGRVADGSIGERVGGRMLLAEIFVWSREPDGGVTFLVEGGVVSAAAEAIVTKDHL